MNAAHVFNRSCVSINICATARLFVYPAHSATYVWYAGVHLACLQACWRMRYHLRPSTPEAVPSRRLLSPLSPATLRPAIRNAVNFIA